MNNRRDLGLLNYEGDVLKLNREGEQYIIYDQWDGLVEILDLSGLCRFLEGRLDLVDSEGRRWNWLEQHSYCPNPSLHYL